MKPCASQRELTGRHLSEPLEPRTLLSATFLKDINTIPNGSSPLGAAFQGAYYFFATSPNFGSGLWKTDGTEAGSTLVSGVTTRLPVVLSPFSTEPLKIFGTLNGELLFAGFSSPFGTELWKTDGTAAGTILVKDTNAGPRDGYPDEFTPACGEMFFRVGLDSPARSQIWRTDGTEAGTVPVLDPTTGQPIQGVTTIAAAGGSVYAVTATVGSTRLWKVDATSSAASVLKDFPADRPPDQLMDVGGALMFAAVPGDGSPYQVVWKSDGTPEGTNAVGNSNPLPVSDVDLLGVTNHVLVYGSSGGIRRTDGTPDGTFLVGTMGYNRGSVPGRACVLGDSLYFTGAPNDGSEGLWRTDGTVAGTQLVASGPYDGEYLTNVNGTLFFRAFDDAHWGELWQSDGTAPGTVLVSDINPGPISSDPTAIVAVGDRAFFTASDDSHGVEPWTSDGTATGTHLVEDMYLGTADASISKFDVLLHVVTRCSSRPDVIITFCPVSGVGGSDDGGGQDDRPARFFSLRPPIAVSL